MSETSILQADLREISPDKIERNPDNPRLFFRGEEMDTLMSSIKQFGVQVPITVYTDAKKFVLIDGERRWRCAVKLNLKSIPALVHEKPSPLENLLLMYNIHTLREQWDYFTIASRLPDVIALFNEEYDREPGEAELSERTGLTRSQIRRCRFLLDLPKRYKSMLQAELALPKQQQQLSEDLFIEMERALKTITTRVPSAISNTNAVRDALIMKFRKGIVKNVTDFRKLSKIATSIQHLGIEESKAHRALKTIFNPNNKISIEEVFSEQFELRYDENKIIRNIESISEYLEVVTTSDDVPQLSEDAMSVLKKLKKLIERVFRVLEMAFDTFTPRLKQVAECGLRYFRKQFGKSGLRILSEINPNINWRPTLQVRPRRSLIVAAEVHDKLYPEILKIAAHDIRHYDFPISVFQICPLEVYLADHSQATVNQLRRDGFGIVTVDLSGRATTQFACIPLAQHIDEKELESNMKGMSQVLGIRLKTAHSTFRNSEGQGLQEAGQLVESVVIEIAEQAVRLNVVGKGILGKPLASMIDDLYALPDFKDHRSALGGARDFIKDYRNTASHPSRTSGEAIDKIRQCRAGFINAIRISRHLNDVFKGKGWRLNLP